MDIPANIDGKNDLLEMRCIGENIQETPGFDGLQNHIPW